MQLDATEGRVRCPNVHCDDGIHTERTCDHSGRCPCDLFEKPCTRCGGTGFVLEEGAAASGSQPPRSVRRAFTAGDVGRGW